MSVSGLREYKYYLIGTITQENKKEINKLTRQIDKQIKEELKNGLCNAYMQEQQT